MSKLSTSRQFDKVQGGQVKWELDERIDMDEVSVPEEVKNNAWARYYRLMAGEWWSCPSCDTITLPYEESNLCESCLTTRRVA